MYTGRSERLYAPSVSRRRFTAVVVASLTGFALALVGVPVPAQASGWVYPVYYWTAYGGSHRTGGNMYGHDFYCFGDCAEGSDLYIYADGGAGVNRTEVKPSIRFDGWNMNVSVSYPYGVGAGFTDGGSTCNDAYVASNSGWVSNSYGSGVLCEAEAWGDITSMTLLVTGRVRVGSSWSTRTATDCIPMFVGGC